MSNTDSTALYPPMGCLSEHLDYFSESIANKHPNLDADFDDIFSKDFDLVFDPEMLANSVPANTAPPATQTHHQPQQQPQQQQQQPVPVTVRSLSFVPPPPQVMTATAASSHQSQPKPMPATSNPYVAPACVTPAVPAKPIATVKPMAAPKTTISKTGPATVSPTSVTAVFESIPQAAPLPKSSPRKRSYSMATSTTTKVTTTAAKPAPAVTSTPAMDTSNLSYQEQEDLRRERNRHHAKRSRQRKRDYMNQLEDAVNDMRKENERLFDLLGMDSTRAKADMAQEEERKRARATEKFIAGLKQPRNRVLDNTTLAFLRELWK